MLACAIRVDCSAASKGLPSLHVIEGANAESDVEEDPFAEFTVMDGLEDLDEMLAEQGPEASPTNVSHGIDPSESLVTAAAASARPGISDAMVSDGELPYAADDTQPTATGQGAPGQTHGVLSILATSRPTCVTDKDSWCYSTGETVACAQ